VLQRETPSTQHPYTHCRVKLQDHALICVVAGSEGGSTGVCLTLHAQAAHLCFVASERILRTHRQTHAQTPVRVHM